MALLADMPAEVLENIFWYLDGISLGRVQLMCRLWKKVVERLDSLKCIWRLCCLHEISEESMIELLGNRLYSPSLLHEDINWKRFYARWHMLSNVGKWPCKMTTLSDMKTTPATCIRLSGSCLISSHRNGAIHVWDISGRYIGKLGQHPKMVLDMVLVDPNKKGKYYHRNHFIEHEYVASCGKDHTIHFHCLRKSYDKIDPHIIRYHSSCVESLRIFETTLLASSVDNVITLWVISSNASRTTGPLTVELLYEVPPPDAVMRWIGFWNDKISCLCHDSSIQFYNINTPEVKWRQKNTKHIPVANSNKSTIIANCFIFQDNIVIFLTADRYMCISVDETCFQCYPTLMALKSYIVSVALFGNLLVLGTERGAVFVYYFKNKQELFNLNLSKPTWHEQISEGSITAIDIRENNGPLIACATSDSLYVIKWTKSNRP